MCICYACAGKKNLGNLITRLCTHDQHLKTLAARLRGRVIPTIYSFERGRGSEECIGERGEERVVALKFNRIFKPSERERERRNNLQ